MAPVASVPQWLEWLSASVAQWLSGSSGSVAQWLSGSSGSSGSVARCLSGSVARVARVAQWLSGSVPQWLSGSSGSVAQWLSGSSGSVPQWLEWLSGSSRGGKNSAPCLKSSSPVSDDDEVEFHVPRMSVDILGTNCDQCLSMVQCCFASTETVRLVRTDSPGRPPRLPKGP